MDYSYGMRLRGFSPGCQPKDGLVNAIDTDKSKTGYHSILTYSRQLSPEEVREYELTPILQTMEDRPDMPTKQTISQRKSDELHCARCDLKLNRVTDAPILAKLASVPSKQGYIKELILEDIKKNSPEFLDIKEYAGKR